MMTRKYAFKALPAVLALTLTLTLAPPRTGCAQNDTSQRPRYRYGYSTILLDSTYDALRDPALVRYVGRKRARMNRVMNEVVGRCPHALNDYEPASPLSNFLTDMLMEHAPACADDPDFAQCDLSLLNFGGIRATLEAGDVTVGDLYAVAPFDNHIVFALLKGQELKKVFGRFTWNDCQPYAGAQVVYRGGRPVSVSVGGSPVDDEKSYRLVTVDFILEGGDGILKDVEFEKTAYTTVLFRDFLIDGIRAMTRRGMDVESTADDRAVEEGR